MAQKIIFYEGEDVLNALDIKRILKKSDIQLASRYVFCIVFEDQPDINEIEKIKTVLGAKELDFKPNVVITPRAGTQSA